MKILYGTGNKEKIKQLEKIIKINNFDLDIIGLKDINFNEEIIENGKTFEENSKIKAETIRKFCEKEKLHNLIIVTDDAGLCVDSLNGEPGVYSARYAGDHAPQEVVLNKLLQNMSMYKKEEERKAEFLCVLTASLPNGEYIVTKGEIKGKIANKIGKLGGLTYEPIFVPEGFNKPISEMSLEEFAKLKNHREIAIIKLINKLKEFHI